MQNDQQHLNKQTIQEPDKQAQQSQTNVTVDAVKEPEGPGDTMDIATAMTSDNLATPLQPLLTSSPVAMAVDDRPVTERLKDLAGLSTP